MRLPVVAAVLIALAAPPALAQPRSPTGWWGPSSAGRCTPIRHPIEHAADVVARNADPRMIGGAIRLSSQVTDQGILWDANRIVGRYALLELTALDSGERQVLVLATDWLFCEAELARARLGIGSEVID